MSIFEIKEIFLYVIVLLKKAYSGQKSKVEKASSPVQNSLKDHFQGKAQSMLCVLALISLDRCQTERCGINYPAEAYKLSAVWLGPPYPGQTDVH